MKLSVIGGGGVRSIFLAKSITQKAKQLNIDEIVFMDINEEKLNIFGKMAKEVAFRIDKDINFTITSDAIEAVKDAKYVITTIRVGGDAKRLDDETIALSHDVLGQETTGAAGFSFAMRSVPALVKYCELIKVYSKKDVKVFNFTNPAGLVSQTLRDMGYDFTYGICDAPSGLLHDFAKLYNVDPERITGECFGLNHLSFFNSIKLDKKEILPQLLENPKLYTNTEMRFFNKDLTKHVGYILNEYLYYYYYREKAVSNIKNSSKTRGRLIYEVNKNMVEELKSYDISKDFDKCLVIFQKWYNQRESVYMKNETNTSTEKEPFSFDIYSADNGGYAGVALKFIEAKELNKDVNMIMCVPNNGSIEGLADSDVVEISCSIFKDHEINHSFSNINEPVMALIKNVKDYERLASKALINKSRELAIDCLMVNPLVNSYSLASSLIDKFIESNKDFVEGWV